MLLVFHVVYGHELAKEVLAKLPCNYSCV